MSLESLRIECHEVFPIVGRGLVFRGLVLEGVAKEGDRVEIQGSKKAVSASISMIEKDRRIVEESEEGVEHGFLLVEFSLPEINDAIQARYDDLEQYPEASHYQELLSIDNFPVSLFASSK